MGESTGWIEISLEVEAELADAVADVLSRYIETGVVVEQQVKPEEEQNNQAAEQVRVYGYFGDDTSAPATQQKIEEALWYLGRISPLPEPNYRSVREADWTRIWKEHYQPTPIGEKLLVQPSWFEIDDLAGRIPILIDPGMAFGTGTHPTTSLSLRLIESSIRGGEPIIDVGCGTAILSIAALKLGAGHALGIDIDPTAIDEAQKNSQLNQVKAQLEIGVGSVESILNGDFSIRSAPLVVVNIIAPKLIQLFPEGLADLADENGVLILSGMLADQEEEVRLMALNYGLKERQRLQDGDWVALHLQR